MLHDKNNSRRSSSLVVFIKCWFSDLGTVGVVDSLEPLIGRYAGCGAFLLTYSDSMLRAGDPSIRKGLIITLRHESLTSHNFHFRSSQYFLMIYLFSMQHHITTYPTICHGSRSSGDPIFYYRLCQHRFDKQSATLPICYCVQEMAGSC